MTDPLGNLPKYWRVRVMAHVHSRAKRCAGYQFSLSIDDKCGRDEWLVRTTREVIEKFKREKWGGRVPVEGGG